MAENNSFKDRLMGLLFEEVTEDDQDDERPLKKSGEVTHLKAQDLLYDKPKKAAEQVTEKETPKESSAFINYGESSPVQAKEPEVPFSNDEYVVTPNISPIFGNLETERKPKRSNNATVDYASIEKPANSPLGMVMSPIYGYDTVKANELRASLLPEAETEEDKEEVIEDFDITEDLGDIFGGDEFKQEAESEEEQEATEEIDLFSDFYLSEDK